jgi:hypothetical protein
MLPSSSVCKYHVSCFLEFLGLYDWCRLDHAAFTCRFPQRIVLIEIQCNRVIVKSFGRFPQLAVELVPLIEDHRYRDPYKCRFYLMRSDHTQISSHWYPEIHLVTTMEYLESRSLATTSNTDCCVDSHEKTRSNVNKVWLAFDIAIVSLSLMLRINFLTSIVWYFRCTLRYHSAITSRWAVVLWRRLLYFPLP